MGENLNTSNLKDNEEGPARRFRLVERVRSFRFAWAGVKWMVRKQHNAWIHLVATVGVVAGGVVCRVSRGEWGLLVLAMAGVWVAEGMNTAVELLCDIVSPERDKRIGRVKDVAAGAVLIGAIGAAVVGGIVFGPRLFGA